MNKQAFDIGYNAHKNNGACIPAQNVELSNLLAPFKSWSSEDHDARMDGMKSFLDGVSKASAEWELEFFANA